MTKGIIISGEFGNIIIREKSTSKIELGEMLVTRLKDESTVILHVFDLLYGSQLPQQALELLSGLKLEEETPLKFFDPNLRNYVLARAKNIVAVKNNRITACKSLPDFFSEVHEITAKDLGFLTIPREHALKIGLLRSGSTTLEVPLYMPGDKVLSHHMLISGTTGRGKSVLMTNLLWNFVKQNYCGVLVLDPHDEYIGRTGIGLKDHTFARENVHYYTASKPIPGGRLLKINITQITPNHFSGVMNWTDPQREALLAYYREYKTEWVHSIIEEKPLSVKFNEATIAVIKRRLIQLLNLEIIGKEVNCKGIFDFIAGQTTISDIVELLEQGKVIIVDTSEFSGPAELLVGTLIATEIFEKHRSLTFSELAQKPVVSIVLEEAPRVLGKDILEQGPNIFSTIAREGRKFKIGLVAITQLPSLIPKEILANINTKIILGTELKQERQALIESAAQDLSTDDRAISSLDKGEAIVTSTFVSFATPIKVQRIEELVKKRAEPIEFSGVKLT